MCFFFFSFQNGCHITNYTTFVVYKGKIEKKYILGLFVFFNSTYFGLLLLVRVYEIWSRPELIFLNGHMLFHNKKMALIKVDKNLHPVAFTILSRSHLIPKIVNAKVEKVRKPCRRPAFFFFSFWSTIFYFCIWYLLTIITRAFKLKNSNKKKKNSKTQNEPNIYFLSVFLLVL